ncbi:MAG: peroxiredoxin family protein, partial [Sedimentisphaerales bacterium]
VSSKVSSLQAGQMVPDFNLTDQFGNMISLSKLRGKIVLLDFWGVWCGPCRRKLPHTQKIHEQFKDKGLVVIGIHSAFRTEKTAEFIRENNYTFLTGIDTGNTAKDYGVTGWPTYYLIDRQGRLVWGAKHSPPPEKLIESLLKE